MLCWWREHEGVALDAKFPAEPMEQNERLWLSKMKKYSPRLLNTMLTVQLGEWWRRLEEIYLVVDDMLKFPLQNERWKIGMAFGSRQEQ